MTHSTHQKVSGFSDRLWLALVAVAFAVVAFVPSTVMAQDSAYEEDEVEEIVVTGTKIKGLDNSGPRPVQVITRTEIDATGLVSVGQLLQSLPGQGSSLNTTYNNGGSGATYVDIRNLGPARTLVLVNGRRWVSSGSGADSAVDLNTIPLSIVERVEILKDGASAIYGTDAISAVVNIILMDNYDGAQLRLQAGDYSASGGGGNRQYSWTFGGDSDRGNFMIVVDYTDQKALSNADRPETAARPADNGSAGTPQGSFWYSAIYDDPRFAAVTGHNDCKKQGRFTVTEGTTGSDGTPIGSTGEKTATRASIANFRCWASQPIEAGSTTIGSDRFNYNPYNYIETPNVRKSVNAYGNYEIFDGINAEWNMLYLNRNSEQLLAPTPLFYGFSSGEMISASNRYNPFGIDLCDGSRCVNARLDTYAMSQDKTLVATTRVSSGISGINSGSGTDEEKRLARRAYGVFAPKPVPHFGCPKEDDTSTMDVDETKCGDEFDAYTVKYVDGNGDGQFGYNDANGNGRWDKGEATTGNDEVVAVQQGGSLYTHDFVATFHSVNGKRTVGTVLADTGFFGRRMLESSNRLYSQNIHTYRVSIELDGEIGDTGWTWNAYWIWAQNQADISTAGLINVNKARQALGPDSGCRSDIDGCVAFDVFSGQGADGSYLGNGLWSGSGTINQAMLNWITFEAHDRGGNESTNYGVDFSGTLGSLGGRPIGIATGFERREQSGYDSPDAVIAAGYSSGNARQPTRGGYSSDDTYFEIQLPLFDNSVLKWDINAAVRQTDYDAFDAVDSLQLNTMLSFLDDTLRFRATYAEGLRAPSISALYQGSGDAYPELEDPCDWESTEYLGSYTFNGQTISNADKAQVRWTAEEVKSEAAAGRVVRRGDLKPGVTPHMQNTHCAAAGIPTSFTQPNSQIRITNLPNVQLRPEVSETIVWGIVWQPRENILVSVDLFDIKIDKAVSVIPAQNILTLCYETNRALYCDEVDRNTTSHLIDDLRVKPLNAASVETNGVDIGFYWNDINVGMGTLDIAADIFYMDNYNTRRFPDADLDRYAGKVIGNSRSNNTRSRMTLGITWHATADWNVLSRIKWYKEADGYRNIAASSPSRTLDATMYLDIQANWKLPFDVIDATLTFGVENVMDEDPPFFPESFANDFDPAYRTWGSQLMSVRLAVNF